MRGISRVSKGWIAAFFAVFAFAMAAEWVCPCEPNAVVDAKTLEAYVKPVIEHEYEIRNVRFSVTEDGRRFDYEGPQVSDEELKRDYNVRETRRKGYTRMFAESKVAPKMREIVKKEKAVSFPFPPCPGHPFGIDAGGRDVYARVVYGLRIALLFGCILALSGMLFGFVIGAIEGYYGGVVDILGQRLTEIWSALPFLYVMIFLGSTVGRSFTILMICYAIFNWITVSYYIRAEFLRLRSRTFVEAAKVAGYSTARIMFRHILPNALTPLITLSPFMLMGAIGSLAALDFLGFGLPPMTPSCGELLAEAQQFRSAWWLVVFPGGALFVVMFLAVMVGEALRDALDPKRKTVLE